MAQIPGGYPFNDEISLEPLFNDTLSEPNGLKRDLRVIDPRKAIYGYEASDQDDPSDALHYYGFINSDGRWYIMQQQTTGTVTTYRYFAGSTGYVAAWAGRGAIVYDYFNNIF